MTRTSSERERMLQEMARRFLPAGSFGITALDFEIAEGQGGRVRAGSGNE